MNDFKQFLFYNLAPSLLAGLLAYLMVYAAITVLRIRYTPLRLCLYFFPVIKSIFVLLGSSLLLPWPTELFAVWQARALPPRTILPFVLLWGGVAVLVQTILTLYARRRALQNTQAAATVSARLTQALEQVVSAYSHTAPERYPCTRGFCCSRPLPTRLRLLVSHRRLSSPLIIATMATPTIVFPVELIPQLTNAQLEQALAHELAHFTLRRPRWCSTTICQWLVVVSPVAWLLMTQLHREEEKACDEVAVAVLGRSDEYAEMLLKSYRYATESAMPLANRLQLLPQLLGPKPILSTRVEHILRSDLVSAHLGRQHCVTCLLSIALYMLL